MTQERITGVALLRGRVVMTDIFRTLIAGVSTVAIFAIIVFGIVSCSQTDAKLRAECISAGGSIINGSNGSFHCISAKGFSRGEEVKEKQ